jgi:hypothetical protein
MAGGAVSDGLAADAILLGGEVESDYVTDLLDGRRGGVEVGFADRKGDVPEAEGVRLRVGSAFAVFPGMEKEEESHEGQIGDGLLSRSGSVEIGDGVVDVYEEAERDGAHASGRRVLLIVGPELSVEAEVGGAETVVAGVRGPHAGEDLGHGAKVLLHGPLANGLAVGGKLSRADFVSEHLEQGDGVVDAVERGVEAEPFAELAPLSPVGAVGGSAAGMDASGNLVLAKAVDSPCCCVGVSWSMVQDVACGKAWLKKETSCESERSQRREVASARWFNLPARNVMGHERSRSRAPAEGEVFVLPFCTHQIEVELSHPLRMAESGAIFGSASHS